MNNIILNIISKKQNLSYSLIFRKIGNYYWNEGEIKRFFNMEIIDIIEDSVHNKWYKILKILIHTENNYAIRLAAKHGHLDIVKYLVENKANISAEKDYTLRWAAANGHFEVVKYLVEKGADIHSESNYALRWAAHRGHLDIVKYLVENGANIYAVNVALCWTTYSSHSEVVKYLREKSQYLTN